MKNLLTSLFFLFSLLFSFNTFAQCEKSLILEGTSPHHKLISSLAFNQLTSHKFYEYVIPTRDEVPDYTLIMHEVELKTASESLELICDLEILSKKSGSLGRDKISYKLALYTSQRNKERYMYKACNKLIKNLFKKIRSCATPPIPMGI